MNRIGHAIAGTGLIVLAASLAKAGELPENLRRIIEKNASFGMARYPVSFWSYTNLGQHMKYMDEAEVEEWADAGFTVPQSPGYDPNNPEHVAHMRKMLDWAQARGMKLILGDPRGYARKGPGGDGGLIPPDYADGIRKAVAQFGDHPALFGLHVGDEPDADMKEAFFECYRVQKEIAPKLHPFANLLPHFPGIELRAGTPGWPAYLDEFVKKSNADLISYDCYAQMNPGVDGWKDYYRNLRLYREAAQRNGVPFWNTTLSVGHFRYRCPNYDELRWQFNTTVCSGASGILWFFYYMRQPHANYRLSPVDENWDRTETYYDIRRFQKDFHRHYGGLFLKIAPTRVNFHPEEIGGGKVFTPNELVSVLSPDKKDHPLLLGEFADVEGRRYVMLVNNSMRGSVYATLKFPGKDVKVFSWNWDGKEYEGGAYSACDTVRGDDGLTISHWLAPGQEAVYRVDSEAIRKAEIHVE
ncbi:MAG TPA: hypothetical protein PL033_04520 [Candidatus Brocadiia bacterium]|nr:hypothetical protein [Candidatus Brocadiia bacterium]